MSIEKLKITYKGFMPLISSIFFVLVIGLFLNSFIFSGFYKTVNSQGGGADYIVIYILGVMFLMVFYFYYKLWGRGLYYFLTKKPTIILDSQGVQFIFPFKGFLPWDNVESVTFVGRMYLDQYLVLITKWPSDLAKKAREGSIQTTVGESLFGKPPENKIRVYLMQLGAKEADLKKAFQDFSKHLKIFTVYDV